MPTYVYECRKCEHGFEQYQAMSDKPLVKCPVCKKHELFRVIQPLMLGTVSSPRTVGALADKNASKMSQEQKDKILEQQKTARDQVLFEQLPNGMSRLEKPSGPAPWYKANQTVPNKKLGSMTREKKLKYIRTGE